MTTWKEIYKRRFIPMQVIILIICMLLVFLAHLDVIQVAIYFVVMEIFNLWGAMWSARMLRKFERPRKDKFDLGIR